MSDLLLEILTEELPPNALESMSKVLTQNVLEILKKNFLTEHSVEARSFATPRRLGFIISGVKKVADEQTEKIRLLPREIGFDNKEVPLPPLEKKLIGLIKKYNGKDLDIDSALYQQYLNNLYFEQLNGKSYIFINFKKQGVKLEQIINNHLASCLKKLPIPKVMKYQKKNKSLGWQDIEFVRPAHSIVLMINNEVIPITVLGISSGNKTIGHRFLCQEKLEIPEATEYEAILEKKGKVIVDFSKRKEKILESINKLATKNNLNLSFDINLLNEITALCEWPRSLLCSFDDYFLNIPWECLTLTMKKNQKYIPLTGDDKKLTNKFIVITNNDPKNPKNIIDGNERVLRARLNDALFFYQKDLMTPFSKRKVDLERITYHNLLGTVNDRVDRITKLVTQWGHQNKINPDDCLTAANNSKNDLSTLMVNEFPELQGIMGKYYFNAEGCNNEVAQSIEDQYKPRFAGDDLPVGKLGKILSLADKSESIAGLISINQTPTGDKDPFAMRRSALGIISILLSENISLNIDQLISDSTALFCKNEQDRKTTANTMSRFLFDRLFFQLKEKGNKPELIRACKNYSFRDLYNIPKLLSSLEKLLNEPTSMEICAINKRIKNILEKIDVYLLASNNVNESLLEDPSEKNLYKLFINLNLKIKQAVKQKSFSAYFDYCLQYRLPIENFFDKVLVNSEDKKIRQNRITLLNCVYRDMNLVADLSSIASTRND